MPIVTLKGTPKELAKHNSKDTIETEIHDWKVAIKSHRLQISKYEDYLSQAERHLENWERVLIIKERPQKNLQKFKNKRRR